MRLWRQWGKKKAAQDVGGRTQPALSLPLDIKTHIPEPRHEWITRSRLVRTLTAARDTRLIFISAPAGFGKSILLAEWRADPAESRPFAWVSLDEADNDPMALWSAIVAALDGVISELDGERLIQPLRNQNPDIEGLLLPRLLNALASLQAPVVLVLDDFHVLRDPDVHWQIESFVDRLPPTVQFALATRTDPWLPLARYRTAGDIRELRMSDLRFTCDETALFVRGIAGIRLSEGDLIDLVEVTEGWPAAIYLAALSLRESTDPSEFIGDFAGTNRLVFDYLSQEVLRPQPAGVRRFLLRTSILDRLTAPLCNVVADTSNATDLLAYLERSNLFLVALDDKRRWFRYHRLFKEALYDELTRTEPDNVSALHRRASAWLAEHELIGEAIGHALAGGDVEQALDLFTRHWVEYASAGRVATVRGWMESIGTARIEREPVPAICAAWIMALSGDRKAMRHWHAIAESLPHDGPLNDGAPSVRFSVELQRAIYGFDGVPEMLRAAETAVALGPEPMSRWYSVARTALGYGRYLSGEYEAAVLPLEEAAQSEAALPTFRILALSVLSLTMGELGHTARAAELARAAYELVEEAKLTETATVTLASTALGMVLTGEGKYEEAWRILERSLNIRRRIVGLTPWPTLSSIIALTQLALATGDYAAARAFLDEARELVAAEPDAGEHIPLALAEVESQVADAASGRAESTDEPFEPLTEREIAVLRLLRGDLSLREIGQELFVSANTVKTHTRAIYRKLGVSSREEALQRAREHGIL